LRQREEPWTFRKIRWQTLGGLYDGFQFVPVPVTTYLSQGYLNILLLSVEEGETEMCTFRKRNTLFTGGYYFD
jgi:hypothetical protein